MSLCPLALEDSILDPLKAMRRPVGILHVKVLRAMKLKRKLMGPSNPYVKLTLTDDKSPAKKTTVKHKNLNPQWNEEFNMVVRDPETQALQLNVYDWEQVGKHEKMGMNLVALKDLPPDVAKVLSLDLLKSMDASDARGQMEVELTYKPLGGEEYGEPSEAVNGPQGTPEGGGVLVVVVHGAQHLEGKHHTNPYTRITFKGEERETERIKKNGDPRWDEEFRFALEEPPVNDKLRAEVLSSSRNPLYATELLGYIDISLGDVVSNKRFKEKYHLIDSKNGELQIELQWWTAK